MGNRKTEQCISHERKKKGQQSFGSGFISTVVSGRELEGNVNPANHFTIVRKKIVEELYCSQATAQSVWNGDPSEWSETSEIYGSFFWNLDAVWIFRFIREKMELADVVCASEESGQKMLARKKQQISKLGWENRPGSSGGPTESVMDAACRKEEPPWR